MNTITANKTEPEIKRGSYGYPLSLAIGMLREESLTRRYGRVANDTDNTKGFEPKWRLPFIASNIFIFFGGTKEDLAFVFSQQKVTL
jgi:hypothetical protein